MNPILKLFLGDYSEVGQNNKVTRLTWIQNTLLALPKGWKILDAGAGERPFKSFCAHMEYVSQDFGKYDGKGDGAGIQEGSWNNENLDLVCDITAMPVATGSFDAVMCTEVLEHVPYPIDAIKEMVRVLKPGGKLIITAPFASLTHFAPYHYCTGFNRYFYEYWLEQFQCTVKELSFNGNYFESVAQEVHHSFEVAAKYSQLKPTLMEKLAQRIFLSFLKKSSQRGPESKELCPFGIMLVAEKKA
jgi:ubiquinone/menaquinone biosynthesis C-methylase UbiE